MERIWTMLALAFLLALAGCAALAPDNAAKAPVSIVPVSVNELPEPEYGIRDTNTTIALDGANDFAFRLSAALAEQAGDNNFVCSPYSVWLPLAALVNATDERYKAELLTALGAAGISEDDLNKAASYTLYRLTNQEDKKYAKEFGYEYFNPLRIANAIFISNNLTLKKDFAQTFMDYYRGSAINVDFGSPETVGAINKWASDNTEGLISDIVQGFDPETVAAIASAIYFSSRWEWEFDPNATKEDSFYSPSGETTAHYMLREGDSQAYYEDEKVQAMPLRFKTGGGMYIILPKDGDAAGLLASMTSKYFQEIQEDSISATGRLLLPRFSVQSDVMGLKDTLAALGVPLFDKASAPLMLVDENIPVWLSGVLHKAVIEVDEKGTTAAAVTIIPAPGAAMPVPTEPFEMKCDRSFVFVLYGNTNGEILFTGIVNRP